MTGKGFVALAGLGLLAGGCQQHFGLAVASIVVGALLLSSVLTDALLDKPRDRR